MIRKLYAALVVALLATMIIPALAQTGSQQNYLSITGGLKTELIPAGKFIDTFNSPTTLDTTNNWSSPTTSGTGATATYTQGQEILNSGTGTNSYALLTSQANFQVNAPAYLLYRGAINAANPEVLGTCKEMGFFIAAGSPTCAAPVTDGILFEITTAGKLQAVTYASGTRTLLADLSVQTGVVFSPAFAADGVTIVCPGRQTPQALNDTCPHILDIWFNGNSAEFDIDFKPVAFMQNGSLGPNNNLLPWSAMTINATSTTGATLKINQAAVGDEARNSNKICDQTSPWRCLTVTAGGALVPSIPSSPITGNATGTTGAVVGTLAGVAAKTTYICGFNVSAIGGTAAVGPITIAGLITSSMVYQMASTASGNTVGQTFTPCVPASAVNTAITITTTADGTASAVDVNSWGYQQ